MIHFFRREKMQSASGPLMTTVTGLVTIANVFIQLFQFIMPYAPQKCNFFSPYFNLFARRCFLRPFLFAVIAFWSVCDVKRLLMSLSNAVNPIFCAVLHANECNEARWNSPIELNKCLLNVRLTPHEKTKICDIVMLEWSLPGYYVLPFAGICDWFSPQISF